MKRIAHLTSAHAHPDNRIFRKECRSIAAMGYEVTLVVPLDADQRVDGVKVAAVRRFSSRPLRMLLTPWLVLFKAWCLRSDLYHFHDPELIPIGLMLALTGKPVVYDIHEDYVTSIAQKPYLPRAARRLIAGAFGALERCCRQCFHTVIAERYYRRRFPEAVEVLNYPPRPESAEMLAAPQRSESGRYRLLYTGTISEDRGAILMAALPAAIEEIEIHLIGRCDRGLIQRMKATAGPHADRLIFRNDGAFVEFAAIERVYREGHWLAGLALFPRTPHYIDKELTKFFEYMRYGLPVLCSDFPTWRRLIVADAACGRTVDAEDVASIVRGIRALIDDPAGWERMARNGHRAARERFAWESQAEALAAVYQRALGS
ncbi:MAG: glycosyltransferase [Phycisphaeraceae bacterium]|nr:glycosyltransferase [Phycisphaeraceae bacterium]